jgi:15-cis-phytoene synthase
LQAIIAQYRLPFGHFDELIRGVEMDLDIKRYQTFEELQEYCYRVASVVGLLSIEIFGYQDPACRQYAIHLGQALQLTNILRDVRNDAERGRIYLPVEELARHKVAPEEILALKYSDRFAEAAASVAARARNFYTLAERTLPAADRRSMIAAELMASVYSRLLGELERKRFDVFGPHPVRLSRAAKILLIMQTWFRLK